MCSIISTSYSYSAFAVWSFEADFPGLRSSAFGLNLANFFSTFSLFFSAISASSSAVSSGFWYPPKNSFALMTLTNGSFSGMGLRSLQVSVLILHFNRFFVLFIRQIFKNMWCILCNFDSLFLLFCYRVLSNIVSRWVATTLLQDTFFDFFFLRLFNSILFLSLKNSQFLAVRISPISFFDPQSSFNVVDYRFVYLDLFSDHFLSVERWLFEDIVSWLDEDVVGIINLSFEETNTVHWNLGESTYW